VSHAINVGATGASDRTSAVTDRPAYHAYVILHIGYAVLPIVAGIDKFFDKLGNWDMYLCPLATRVTGLADHTFMTIVGVIEIVAGLVVAFVPRVGAWVVTLWLWGIIINLFLSPLHFYDIALRDFGLSLGAIALARLACEFGRRGVGTSTHV
jgi:hypothetical protein